jgi:protein phosphatase-4 regulatory subunit 3
LSFQDAEGCTDLWEQICSLQGRSTDDRGASDAEASGGSSGYGGADTAIQLPAAELRNVAAIAELISEVPMFKRQRLIELILSSDYVPELAKLFSVAEDLESAEDLQHIYHIFKGLILLNDGSLYELLLKDDVVMDVFGALEYDPENGAGQRAEHRAFFEGGKRFKLVVPISDEAVLKKIHQNYHLCYLKDVVLPRALDDNAFAALNQIAFCNNVNIVSALGNDAVFFQTLRDKLADEAQEPDALLDALRLLQELCTIAKQLQLYNRSAFYRKFCEHACFAPLAAALRRPQPEVRLAALEVLLASTQHEPSLLRQFILGQRPDYELCNALISVLATPGGSGEKPQATEVLRALLDPEGMEGRERDDFLNTFYEEFVDKVAQPVTGKVAAGTGPLNGDAAAANGVGAAGADEQDMDRDDVGDVLSARQHVCELLSFFVTKHTHRIKYFILRNNVLCRVLKLAQARDKGLVLGKPLAGLAL